MSRLTPRTRGILAAMAALTTGLMLAGAAPSAAVATPADTLCTGSWNGTTATVQYRRALDGRLSWRYFISNQTTLHLGPIAAVSMPFAYLNGLPINPPYQEHVEVLPYDFHGSVNTVQFIGGGGGTHPIATGDILTMYWFMYGVNTGNSADNYVICQVPAPGAG